jgi:general secretion pathway protein A
MSPRHQEGLAHLLYGINFAGGFVALTGEVGTGKTTLCRYLLQKIPENIEIALILNSKLNAVELLATICDELGINYDKNQLSLKNLIDLLNQHLLMVHANGKRTVLLIDEAQNLSMEVLEQIRLLTNLETSKAKLLQIILVGQPELKVMLKRQDLRQLNQRITARYHLLPLSLEETRAYIRHRLIVCNGNPELFKQSAIRKIYKISAGIPRVVNILCDRALLGAYSANATIITAAIVNNAAAETIDHDAEKRSYLWSLLSLLLLVGIAAGVYHQKQWLYAIHPTLINVAAPPVKPEIIRPTEQKKTLPVEMPVAAPVVKAKSFHDWINNPEYSLNATLISALKLWGKPVPENNQVDCNYVETTGLRCVFGKATWKELLAMNRPAIMEFNSTSKQMPLALLTGLNQNQSKILFNDEVSFPVEHVLKEWNSYYLILEPSSIEHVKLMYPHQTSDDILSLRHLLSSVDGIHEIVDQPRYYDDNLVARVVKFQHEHQLPEDGKVGDKTIFYLKNIELTVNFPHLKVVD